jgi:hypothetical protein
MFKGKLPINEIRDGVKANFAYSEIGWYGGCYGQETGEIKKKPGNINRIDQ